MTQTRKRPGGGSPDAINETADQSEFSRNDSPSLDEIPPMYHDEFRSLVRWRRAWLDQSDRAETFDERRHRLAAQADPAVHDALERRRAELEAAARLKTNLAHRRALRDHAEDLRRNRPGYEACSYSDHSPWAVEVREFADGRNETNVVQLRCKSVQCSHCGPWWLADKLEKLAEAMDPSVDDYHVTIAADAKQRSKVTRRFYDRCRNHGDRYAAVSVPTIDGRFVIVSTTPTATSTRADYAEALGIASSAFQVIRLAAAERGANPIEGMCHRFVGDWRALTNDSPSGEGGANCEPCVKRSYLAWNRPGFGDSVLSAADEHNGRTARRPTPEIHSSIANVVDCAEWERELRHLGATSTEERRRRQAERTSYLRWQEQIESSR